jgi:uncharacterized protein (TIGR02594 family)
MKVPGLPTRYQWLTQIKGLPNTIREGLKLYGTQEVVGKGSNRTIIGWRDELNGASTTGKPIIVGFHDDDIPWCGLFAAIVVYRRLRKIDEVVASPLWARNWAKYGVKSPLPSLGDVLVFTRGSGGHVGFYTGEDATAYHVLGGNQSNSVNITRIAKSRLLACRRPPYVTPPVAMKPFRLAATGGLSTNEA